MCPIPVRIKVSKTNSAVRVGKWVRYPTGRFL